MCNIVLTIVTMLYTTTLRLTHFITGSLYLRTTLTHFVHPYPWQPPICFFNLWVPMFLSLHSTYKWDDSVFVSLWSDISFSINAFKIQPCGRNGKLSFFLWLINIHIISFFIHSPTRWLNCFHIWAVVTMLQWTWGCGRSVIFSN